MDSVAVVSCDLDSGLCQSLTVGDMVLLETNGQRMYSSLHCPLVDVPWKITKKDKRLMVVQHPNGLSLSLKYSKLLKGIRTVVFKVLDKRVLPMEFYVIPQLISHFMPRAEVGTAFKMPNDDGAETLYTEPAIREALYDAWGKIVQTFVPGWSQVGLSRWALRCLVDLEKIEALRDQRKDVLDRIRLEEFLRIRTTFHWMPMILDTVQDEVRTEKIS